MIRNLITRDKPVGDECVVRVVQRREVGHLDGATVRILALGQELVDGVESVGLDCIIGGVYNKLGNFGLIQSMS